MSHKSEKATKETSADLWKLARRMFRFAGPHAGLLIFSIILSWFIVLLEAVYLWIPASLIQTLFNPERSGAGVVDLGWERANQFLNSIAHRFTSSGDTYFSLKLICILLLAVALLKNVAAYVQALVVGKLKLNIVRDMRNTLYRHVTRLPFSYFDRKHSGKVVSRVLNDVEAINASIMETLTASIIEPVRIVVFLALMIIVSPRLTLLVFTIYPVLIYGIIRIGHSVRRRSKRMLHDLSVLISVLSETILGMRVVKMFNRHDHEAERFERANAGFVRMSFRALSMSQLAHPVTDTLGAAIAVVLLLYGGSRVLDPGNGFTAEDFMRFLVLLLSMYRPIKIMARTNMFLQTGLAAAQRVFETIDEPSEQLAPLDESKVPQFSQSLAFEHVSFRYPGHDKMVLNDLSFDVPRGAVFAIVGSSGSGKSTIIDCIPRFYDLVEGRILLDGRDVTTLDLVAYRHIFGTVSQDVVLFAGTIRDNIAYGVEGASDEAVRQAAEQANAWGFISDMPDGLQTVIGEDGVTLSGGQRQRLAIARALLKNPPILLLDEATSSLDMESEREVQRALANLMRDRTTVVVAHRLATVQHADMIIVIDDGRIVEQGKHDELLALNGSYRRYYDMQFLDADEQSSSGD